MGKFRVWELARMFQKSEKEVVDALRKHHIEAKGNFSAVDESVKTILDKEFNGKNEQAPQKRQTERTKRAEGKGKQLLRKRRRPVRTVRFDEKSGKPKEEFYTDGKGRILKSQEEKTPPKQAPKESQKPEPKPEVKPVAEKPQETAKAVEKKVEKKIAQQTEKKVTKSESKPAPEVKKEAAVSQPKSQPEPEPKLEVKAEKKQTAKKEEQAVAKPEPKPQTKQEPKAASKPVAKPARQAEGRGGKQEQGKKENQRAKDRNGKAKRSERTQEKDNLGRDEEFRKNDRRGGGRNAGKKGQRDRGRGRNRDDKRDKSTSLLAESIRKSKAKGKNRNERNVAQDTTPTEVAVPPSSTVKELAELFHKEVGDVIKRLMMLGIMATINQEVDQDAVELLADEYGITLVEMPSEEDITVIPEIVDDPSTLVPRPPVVTIMGHVDHGKTSLLDTIRKANVTANEAGGITQHIGAYQIRYQGKKIVFLDTPGHEAFTAMRARGAQVTDIAILVVAADDGVMPQTIEAINHAKAAGVPILVAINKIDKPAANPDHVKQQLAEQGLLPEEWGGDAIMVPVSAKKRLGIDDLLENILLVAEVSELKANPNRDAVGVVIEGELDKGRGPVVTVLVQNGTLRVGDGIIAGTAFGRVRAMINEKGDQLKKAEPSTPVEVLGLSELPVAGEMLYAMDERKARDIAEKRAAKYKLEEQNRKQKVTLDDLFNQIKEGELKNLNIIIKGDVQGSVEALRQSFEAIKSPEVKIDIVHAGVGAITESDIMLASAGNALIIGFNVRPDANIRKIAENEQVDMRTYRVIYDAIDDVKMAMQGMLAPKYKEVILGRAEIRQVIPTPKVIVAGSYVTEGKITNSAELRLIRDGIVIHEGKIGSLRRFKDDVREVPEGYECGISIESYRDVKEGDIIEAFMEEEVAQTLE